MDVGNVTHDDILTDIMRLTLYIITKIGFGVSLLWPGEKPSGKQSVRDTELSNSEPPEGYTEFRTCFDRVAREFNYDTNVSQVAIE
jgi:hypothetical protein